MSYFHLVTPLQTEQKNSNKKLSELIFMVLDLETKRKQLNKNNTFERRTRRTYVIKEDTIWK